MLSWFSSRAARHANAMAKHVIKLVNHQRDLLTPQAIEAVDGAINNLRQAARENSGKEILQARMQELENAANKWLRPYPHPAWRENIEVLLVALAVAMAIRTFFIQPFKIPTGSMQPTLYGVDSVNHRQNPNLQITTGLERVKEWFQGISYLEHVAETDGVFGGASRPLRFLIFNIRQTFVFAGKTHTIWFPPDYGSGSLELRAGIQPDQFFKRGETVFKLKIAAGDHLFVDRLTYNFRPPQRGEIIVFETKGIPEANREAAGIPPDQFYIKRLVGLGGENIKIGPDRHLVINGQRLDANTPRFHRVYGFNPADPPRDSRYSGHVYMPLYARFFDGKPDGVQIPKDYFMVMGDNTMNSLDSRAWGWFPSEYVIGKAFFVYWPLTSRFGTGYAR